MNSKIKEGNTKKFVTDSNTERGAKFYRPSGGACVGKQPEQIPEPAR